MTIANMNSIAEFENHLKTLPGSNKGFSDQAAAHQDILTKPQGSLGRLEEIAIWMAGWQRQVKPSTDNCQCIVFAGNHGVAAQGVSAFPPEVTTQMVENFKKGGAAINQLTDAAGATLNVVALALDKPTNDFTVTAAMSEEECLSALRAGAKAVDKDTNILLLGEMGIANTTSAAAVALSTFGGTVQQWVGYGSGIDEKGLKLKQQIVANAVDLHTQNQNSSFDILRTVGGRELAAIAGAVLEARHLSIPIILDGFISTAAAAVLLKDNPAALEHTLVSHLSAEPGHKKLIDVVNKKAILNLGMRLGEASGAAVALMIIKAAVAAHNGMATFDEAGVSANE